MRAKRVFKIFLWLGGLGSLSFIFFGFSSYGSFPLFVSNFLMVAGIYGFLVSSKKEPPLRSPMQVARKLREQRRKREKR